MTTTEITKRTLPGIGTLTVYHDNHEQACLVDLRVREVLDAGQIDVLTAALADAREALALAGLVFALTDFPH